MLALLPQPVTHLRQLRLLDMLCGGDRVGSAEQQRRQQLVFDSLIAPLVRAAELRPLPPTEQKLLVRRA